MESKLNQIYQQALQRLEGCTSPDELYKVKVDYLGKQGELSLLMKEMGQLPKEQRPASGKVVNEKKQSLEQLFFKQEEILKQKQLLQKLATEKWDLTLPGPAYTTGHRHPLSQVMEEIIAILSRIGFSVRTGPMIESDWFNFEALNIPPDHPARDMQDTFYVDQQHVLRTHTSPVQIHTMQKEKPPLRILAPGSVFRCDSDVTHSPNFYQIEGLYIDKEVSMAHLKGTISYFVKQFFGEGITTRFRPSFFPFTEPSAEVDCSCPICKGQGCRVCSHTGWIEIGGSGLVNPKVLIHAGLVTEEDPNEWQGFAFGFGVERMAMIKHGISDIRLFNENDLRFLGQF